MFCGECGTQNPDTNQFCRNCGKPLLKQQPAAQPAAATPQAPAPAMVFVQPPVTGAASPSAPAPVPGAGPKRARNWLGIVSLILGILSWGILTVIVAIAAVLIGIVSIFLYRKATGRIGISSIIGIVLGILAIVVSLALA
jgi:hypothetical protein